MTFTAFAFGLMGLASIMFVAATMARELNFKLPEMTQTGDSSLSKYSINWLAARAFLAALLICFGLV